MKSAPWRTLALAACLALAAGCDDHDEDNIGGAPASPAPGSETFFDDFSGSFPNPKWEIRDGAPFTWGDVGHQAPGLVMRPFGDKIRLRGKLKFSTAKPLTLSFDLAAYELQWSSRFKIRIVPVESGSEASFEAKINDGEVRLRIGGSDDEDDFAFQSNGGYHEVMFVLDDSGAASWRINGKEFMKRDSFSKGMYRIQLETSGGDDTKFVVDNVAITRP
jgi:hypothetical protein